ncbi:F-box/FBD/LRR-repeat protein isoform X1, partial [Tanacetum coccineum]
AIYDNAVPLPAVCSPELDCRKMGQLRLQKVVLYSIRGLENEVCLIKYLLACSPFLKKMVIHSNSTQGFLGDCRELMVTKMLLKLHLASPTAEIDLY